jgi:invasion protein IalB
MPFSLRRLGAAGIAGFLLLAGGQAFAQAKKPAAPNSPPAAEPTPMLAAPMQAPISLLPTQNEWTKVCGKDQAANKEICYTTRDFSAQADQPPVLALAVYDIKGDDTRIVRLLMPVGLMLRPGFRFTVDKGPEQEGGFEICFPNGCFAEAKIKGTILADLKKGTAMNVTVKNQVNNLVTFAVPLAGFGKAFDGPAKDPKELEEERKKFEAELQKRAEEERKKLEAAEPAKTDSGKPAQPASPAPAAPKK